MGIDQVTADAAGMRKAVFLDRDGVINRNVLNAATGAYESPGRPEDFHLAPGAIEAVQRLAAAGHLLFLVSNQPNYAKGKSSLADLAAVHRKLEMALDSAGVQFTAFYYCYHHPQGVVAEYSGACDCRKPSPYFLFKAQEEHGAWLRGSWMVGDREADVQCGRAAGARTIRVAEDHPASRASHEARAEFEARDLAEAVEIILASGPIPAARTL